MVNMFNINMTIYDYMREYRAKTNTVALVRGSHKMKFGKFFKEIDRVAGGLSALGIKRGDVVMSALPNIEQQVILTYAVSRIGAISSVVHPLLTASAFKNLYDLQKPKVLFLSEVNALAFGKVARGCKKIYCPFYLYLYVGLPMRKKFEPTHTNGSEPAFYMHSGGTTGVPKTVVLASSAVNALARNLLKSMGDERGENDAILVTLPLFHGFGMCVGVHTSISTNMMAVLLPKFSGKKAVKAIVKNKITAMIAVPRMLVKLLATSGFEGKNIATLKEIYVGGDAINPNVMAEFNSRLAVAGSKGRLCAGYGLTEAGSCVAVENGVIKPNTVGRVLSGMDAMVMDENDNEVQAGEIGELWLTGEQLMSGYLGDEKLTNEVMVKKNDATWLRTGDYFKRDAEGYLSYMGRKKRLIKISGINVFPSEIERVASEFPFVRECVACETTSNGKTFIKLFVEGGLTEVQKTDIINKIANELSHWSRPSEIVCINSLPRTNVSKIDIKKLQKEYCKEQNSGA